MESAAVDNKKRDQRKEYNKNKGYHGHNKNKDKDRKDRDGERRPSGKKNGTEKTVGRKPEAEAKTSEVVANGAVANKEATETTTVEEVKEPELDEEELEKRRMQEEEQKRQEEISALQEFIDEAKRRNEWKATLRTTNQNIESRPEESDLHKLDSSLKKNTAFIRKIKNFTDGQRDVVKKEMASLNLTKYIGEVAAALVEAKLKTTDLSAALEISSFLHQRYAEFSEQLMENWQKALSFKKDNGEKAVPNPSKLRVDLRFYADLVSVGIFTLKEGLPLLGRVLTELVNLDKEEHAHVSIVLTFCKNCGDDYAGLVPRKMTALAEKHSYEIPTSSMLPPEKQKGVRTLLKEYYRTASRHLVTQYRELQNTERTNRRILLTKGEVHEERKQKAEMLRVSYSKLLTNTDQLADILDEDLPDLTLEDKKVEGEEEEVAEMEAQVEESALGELWEDEETKAFYENLTDLKAIVPGILYKDSAKEQVAIKEENLDEDDVTDDADVIEDAGAEATATQFDLGNEEDTLPPFLEDEPEEQETPNTSAKMIFDAFLSKLPTCVGRELIDSAAVDFCMSMNTKNNRKKLVKALFNVPRIRLDLLPFYSRLVATLYPCMPEVAVDLSGYLKQDFRYQVRKKDQMKVEAKNKVCRFIGEMVKFGMFPKGEALFCMKMLLFDFTHHHIEMACTLMETCGRFLYRTPDSHTRAKTYLEAMMRKKNAVSMDNRYSMMIENAYYIVNPPQSPAMAVVTRPPLHEYIRKLLYHDLGKNTTEKVLKQIRKLDWSDPEMAAYATGCISAVWNIKYYNIRFAASLLAGLASHHDWVASRVVDAVLEDIRMQMEKNDPSHNQRRISVVKYLGELYNYRLVDSSVIFKVLYSFLTFGALGPEPGAPNPFDPPEHMLRIRLICVMLETCAIYFSSGSSKKKLDYFFAYFQRYYWLKRAHPTWTDEEEGKPFPVAIIHVVSETIPSLRPKVKLCESLDEALDGVEKIEEEVLAALAEKNPELSKNLRGTTVMKQPLRDALPPGGLHAIAEEGDEEFVISGRKSAAEIHDSDDEDSNSNSRSRSQSQRDEHHFDFEDEDDSEESDDEDDDEDDISDDDDDDDEDDDTQEERFSTHDTMKKLHETLKERHLALYIPF